MMTSLQHAGDRAERALATRRNASARERANPPPMIKKVNFCNAAAAPYPGSSTEPQ